MGTSWATIVPSSVGGQSTFFVAVKGKKYKSQELRALYVVQEGKCQLFNIEINVENYLSTLKN